MLNYRVDLSINIVHKGGVSCTVSQEAAAPASLFVPNKEMDNGFFDVQSKLSRVQNCQATGVLSHVWRRRMP